MPISLGISLGLTALGTAVGNFLASAESIGNLILTTDGQNIILDGDQ